MHKVEYSCNVLIAGKSGVGKSSFCNYIFGEELFRTGEGMPVTDWENHFQSRVASHSGMNIKVYDTVGIEQDNLLEWKSRLYTFLDY